MTKSTGVTVTVSRNGSTTGSNGIADSDMRSNRQRNQWKDLPYRLGTICIGIPILWLIWCHDTLRVISFYVIHSLCAYEYMYRITMPSTTFTNHKNNNNTMNRQGHLFMILSWILLALPTLYFVPVFIITMAGVSLIALTLLQLQVQRENQQSPPPPSTSSTPTFTVIYYLNIMIIWFHGVLFITLPFRSWMAVTTTIVNSTATTTTTTIVSGFQPTISLLLTVWNCDTGALLFGRLFGMPYRPEATATTARQKNHETRPGPPLVSLIRQYLHCASPSKSLEGLLGGIFSGTVTYAFLLPTVWYYIQYYHLPVGRTTVTGGQHMDDIDCLTHDASTSDCWTDIGIGLLLSIGAVVGDMIESLIKRYHHCKDSSSLLPGHGGIYDRFDSSLLSIVLYQYFILSIGDNRNDNNNNRCSMIVNRGY